MKYTVMILIILFGCTITRNSREIFPRSDKFIQGNYSHYFGRGAMVYHNKVYEFSKTGECFSSGLPYGPDSHGNRPGYYGKYYIKKDTLRAFFYMYPSFSSMQNRNDCLTKDGVAMTMVDTLNVNFYIKNKDSIIELPLRKIDVIYKLNNDSLSFLPVITKKQ